MTTLSRAVLTSGTAHPDVHELGRLLAAAGYENSVSAGENPFGIVDESVLRAIAAYRAEHSIEPELIPGMPTEQADRWVGPNLWASIAPEPVEDETDEQRAEREQAEREAKARKREQLRAQLDELGDDDDQEPAPSWPQSHQG